MNKSGHKILAIYWRNASGFCSLPVEQKGTGDPLPVDMVIVH